MYERAFRLPVGCSAGVVVAALTLCGGFIAPSAMAQSYGKPSVTVDDSVLDELGPPPKSLPDVLLMQQPNSDHPAQKRATASQAQGRLLPPPPAMPKSRVTLPGSLRQMLPEGGPAARPQTARAPKAPPAPKAAPTPKVERVRPPEVATAPRKPSVVPPKISAPKVSVPETPAVKPPPAPPTMPTPEVATHAPAAPAAQPPAAPPVAKTEMPKAPTPATSVAKTELPTAPTPTAAVPKVAPAPAAAKSEPSKAEKAAMPETAAVPPPPTVEPPAPPKVSAPPAPAPSVAAKAPAPRAVPPAPQVAETPPPPKAESQDASGSGPASERQLASLPPPGKPEILESGQMYRIPFASTSSELSEAGKKYLDKLSQRLKKDDSLRLQLLGYAGSTHDSASKARRTSLFRALSVRTYLMKQGIRSTRMDVRALGNLAEGGAPDRVDAVIRK